MSYDLWTSRLQIKLFIFAQKIVTQIKIEYLKSELYFNRQGGTWNENPSWRSKGDFGADFEFRRCFFRNAERWI